MGEFLHANRSLVGATTSGIGSFVAGFVCKQPEVVISGLCVAGPGVLILVSNLIEYVDRDFVDSPGEVTDAARQIIDDAFDSGQPDQ